MTSKKSQAWSSLHSRSFIFSRYEGFNLWTRNSACLCSCPPQNPQPSQDKKLYLYLFCLIQFCFNNLHFSHINKWFIKKCRKNLKKQRYYYWGKQKRHTSKSQVLAAKSTSQVFIELGNLCMIVQCQTPSPPGPLVAICFLIPVNVVRWHHSG
jgi:hypothetical protein